MADRLPSLVPIRQELYAREVGDVGGKLAEELRRASLQKRVRPGERIAITAGSRGIANLSTVLRGLVDAVRELGADPFLVPSMGSHGGATAEGQIGVLESLGVTEKSVGAPIRSSMKTVSLGKTEGGWDVFMDANAHDADGILVVNRIKPHTDFRATYESGLMKMMCIGLGKRDQAELVHATGVKGLQTVIPEVGRAVLATGKVRLGIALMENGYGRTADLIALAPEEIPDREKALLRAAKRHHPSLPFDDIDVLIVDLIGKEISGAGMDTNVIGRLDIRGETRWSKKPRVGTIVLLDVSEPSHGNAIGCGLADITTQRMVDRMNRGTTYTNLLVSTFLERGKIPPTYATDREAMQAAFFLHRLNLPDQLRVVRIRDTQHIDLLEASPNLLDGLRDSGRVTVLGDPRPLSFDGEGALAPMRAAA
ncbi:MAG TPA: lactate racemase domain-containing protein [Armatimonadota bacterium]|jgi:hypothetical protein